MTYSIVARDPATGDFGVAVQSHWFAAGDAIWARAGVGAVATQAQSLMSYGPLGLDRMRAGASSGDALVELTAADESSEHRQVAMVDLEGRVAVHTGDRCIREAGHRVGEGFSCQANMMLNDIVWDAMHAAFTSSEGDFADRLMVTLEAAEGEGGDIRGRQAARILVVRAEPSAEPWTDTLVDLRVDDHDAPLVELRRLLELKRAYDHLGRAEELDLAEDAEGAARETAEAFGLAPGNPEIAFWTAVAMAGKGQLDAAREMIAVAYATHPGWEELLRRLARDGFVEMPAGSLDALLSFEGDG